MKNKKIIIISSVGSLMFLIILMVVFIILGIIPNPFLDTSDLVCKRDNSNATVDEKIEEEMIFMFDNKAIIKSYKEVAIYTYKTEEEAKEYYGYIKDKTGVELNKNILTKSTTYIMEKNIGYYGKTKKELKQLYEGELSYVCE